MDKQEKQRLIVMIVAYLLAFGTFLLAKSQAEALEKSIVSDVRITSDKQVEYKGSFHEDTILRYYLEQLED